MGQQDNIFSIRMIRKKGKLVFDTKAQQGLMMDFVDTLEDGQVVEAFFEASKDNGTNPQLAKIHACIRKLAVELGYTFDEMKYEIKRRAGLVYPTHSGQTHIKSFADCSKEDLSSVIEALNIAGEMVNIHF